MKHLFIINPAAGSYNQTEDYRKKIADICEAKGLDYSIRISGAPGRCRKIAREAAESGREYRIYACGGDGTLNEVVNGAALHPHAAVGCYPCGSGNDFVKYYGGKKYFSDIGAGIDRNRCYHSIDRDRRCALQELGRNLCVGGPCQRKSHRIMEQHEDKCFKRRE